MKVSRLVVGTLVLAMIAWALQIAAFGEPGSTQLKIGDAAPDFSLPNINASDSSTISLSSLKGKIVVLCFDSIHCPVAGAYHQRMNQFYTTYCQKTDAKTPVVYMSINANEGEAAEDIKAAAGEYGAKYPILKDAGSKVADLYGATCTPHVFIVNADGKISYMGAFDDAQRPNRVSKHYVADAVDALLAGQKVTTPETQQFGCAIHRP